MAAQSDIVAAIQATTRANAFRLTQHAQQEMVEDAILLDDIIEAIATGRILEDYPTHRRGACCLLYGVDRSGRDIHIVCTAGPGVLIIVTVYLPKRPKWISPTERSNRT